MANLGRSKSQNKIKAVMKINESIKKMFQFKVKMAVKAEESPGKYTNDANEDSMEDDMPSLGDEGQVNVDLLLELEN